MDFMKDPEIANSYRKHKVKVKKWEKDFKKKFGRIPSKYDIKEAASDVRYSYKRYFEMKTSALEESLSQLDGDLDVSNFDSFGSMDGFDSFTGSQDVCDDYLPNGITLPTMEGLQKLLEGAPKPKSPEEVFVGHQNRLEKNLDDVTLSESSSTVWGNHLSKNKNKESLDDNKVSDFNTTLSQRLHSKTTFPKMPRKSLKKCTSNTESNSSNAGNDKSVNQNEILKEIDTDLDRIKIVKSSETTSFSLNVLNTSQNAQFNLFKIDEGWLKRCQYESKTDQNKGTESHKTLIDIQLETTEYKESLDKKQDRSGENLKQITTFGLSNVNITPMANDIAESHFSDYVENSESEDESISKVLKSKIRPVLKKRKLENQVPKVDTSSSIDNKKYTESKHDLTCKVKSKLKTKKSKQNSQKRNIKLAIPDTDTEEPVFEDYYPDVNSELRSVPRYQFQPSVLKDKNLIDGLASVVEFTMDMKKQKKAVKKSLTPEERLQLKIDSGTLNENFVSINIEKKVYVRGKKNVSYSTFKKQQWKKKKAALGGPDFPTAGVMTCFKCGESGHMSRYCTAHKGETLLPLEAVRDSGLLPTLEEAKISNSEFNEAIEGQPKLHPIPESFLKLLNEPTVLTNSQKKSNLKVMPIIDGQITNSPEEVHAALKEFGHSEFRPGQERAILRILSGQSTLVTLSTGSGKSLCYQLPAYLYAKRQNCITIVISPLVSLMEDQVLNMPSFLRAGCLHTNQSPTQRSKIMELIKDGMLDILLISPEAVVSSDRGSGFGGLLRQLPPIAFACIDEVHCVSQWSHNFRPTYLMICRVLKEKLKVSCILGLSATATTITMKAVIGHIGIMDGLDGVITNLPLPNNLLLSVSRDDNKDRALLNLLTSEKFMEYKSIIVYCIRRDICEQVAAKIRATIQRPDENKTTQINIKKRKKVMYLMAAAYHAGMSSAQRRKVQENFMNGNLRIVVATIAFGMGIDKSNVRGVIHYNMPSTFESYVQEVGRAGRDGLPAHCHVFINMDNGDKNELLRHIYANSIERHAIRKLLQRVFVPCQCKIKLNEITHEIDKENNSENTEENMKRCEGHEVAIPIDDCVAELDIPSENIMTLLCYLELHPKNYVRVLNNAYVICKVMSYNGSQYLQKLAHLCPPLAMGLAFVSKQGGDVNKENTIEFNVIEVAAAIGWDSGMAKYHLKNLEWEKVNGLPKKAPIRIEFHTLGFRLKAPGDLSSLELDGALDILYARVQSQERNMVYQLEEISKTLFQASHKKILDIHLIDNNDDLKEKSDKLKETIREYFKREVPKEDVELEERHVNEARAISDIRGLINAYRDCVFTGRAIARILQGVSSPNFPALVWGRCPFWRTHLHEDFNKISQLATQQIIQLK